MNGFDPNWPHGFCGADPRNIYQKIGTRISKAYSKHILENENGDLRFVDDDGLSTQGTYFSNAPAPKRKVEFWVNVMRDGACGMNWSTLEEANSYATDDRIACLHIVREYEEGEGL